MEIRPYLHYLESEILPLYKAVGWSNYYERPEMLRGAFENSLCVLGAYEEGSLVGIIRAVGDGYSLLFIQDILVYPEYQRRGIGTALMQAVMERYPHVYQTQLATDNTEKTVSFYKSLGFEPLQELGVLWVYEDMMSFRASAHTDAGIPTIEGECHTSLRTGSQ